MKTTTIGTKKNCLQNLPFWFTQRVEARLEFLYGKKNTPTLMNRLINMVAEFKKQEPIRKENKWSEHDVVVITYGDSIIQKGERPLATLYEFLTLHLKETINTVHILPYFPFSSDDGFAVVDYREVNPNLGQWDDINRIATQFKLMTDLVINHVSSQHIWFKNYLNNQEPGRSFFIEVNTESDISSVVRPRSTPLRIPIHSAQGLRYVWATFGEDQIDVNFKNPDVLFEFLALLLLYLRNSSQLIRLDAIAFLWKNIGTRCINLRETHEVVKLIRDVMDLCSPKSILITETNIPNGENVSYFGNSDEAHMVYQFSLPPLLLHALLKGDSHYLSEWSKDMPRPPKGCTYFNFIASHDGIGLRPAEGLLPPEEISALIEDIPRKGGFISMKANSNGVDTPYEINISLFDALAEISAETNQTNVQRLICAHAIMLVLQGIPAIYIHSFTATQNDTSEFKRTGRTRSINRHKWDYDQLFSLLNDPDTTTSIVFHELKNLLALRRRQKAFHPEAAQETLILNTNLFAIWRTSLDNQQKILAISNVTSETQTIKLPPHPIPNGSMIWREIIGSTAITGNTNEIFLQPYQSVWLEALD